MSGSLITSIMQKWLIEKNIDFPPKALKAQLWDIIKEELKNCPEYCIDKMINELDVKQV